MPSPMHGNSRAAIASALRVVAIRSCMYPRRGRPAIDSVAVARNSSKPGRLCPAIAPIMRRNRGAGQRGSPTAGLGFPRHDTVLRDLVGANPSPIAQLQYVNAKAVALDEVKEPLLPAGDPLLRSMPVKGEARPYGMPEVEDRRSRGNGRFRFVIEQEHRDEAAAARLQHTGKLRNVILDLFGQHVSEDRGENRQVESVVAGRKAKGCCGNAPLRI